MQDAFTQIVCSCVTELATEAGEPNIFLSGGCGLNIIANCVRGSASGCSVPIHTTQPE